jgi:phosphoribosylformylglycinamidine synthase
MKPSLAVITFPGNNCETESLRAAQRNGFDAELVLWNEIEKIGKYDAYCIIGGFAFEDRGRSGALSAREPIADALRKEAQKGKVILGICNGAQMIIESGMIPIGGNPVPFALTHNVRRNQEGHVMGTGYYNTWVHLKRINPDTAFTIACDEILRVPVAHGEGRFASLDDKGKIALSEDKNVAFRYCDFDGNIDHHFPITPNGSSFATAMIVNDAGTVGAMMPHPERFYQEFDGDQIFRSMKQWITEKKSPPHTTIGSFHDAAVPSIKKFIPEKKSITFEKKLIITDNEAFSVSQTASHIAKKEISLQKSLLYEITGNPLNRANVVSSGLILNENKEQLIEDETGKKYAVLLHADDTASSLSEKLSAFLGGDISVKIYTCWNFGDQADETIEKILKNRLLANPNAAELYHL